jgi:hypothetical protein
MKTEIERRQDELIRGREKYERAQAEIKVFNPNVIMDLYEIASKYNPGDDANKAIWTLAQLSQVITSAATPFRIVADYERKKDVIKKASGE